MADVRELAPFMLYMPHNSILWVWWRTGTIGFVLFWAALGNAIIQNCLLARRTTDPTIRRWAVFAVALVVMHMLMAWLDVGLFSYRQIVYIWIVQAVPDVLCRLCERPTVVPVMIGVRT
jgi:O-antigen ligase